MSIKYRPEIDGLRTIAVGAVIFYHMKLKVGDTTLLPGGYLGVDIFFVLSGFLITSILLQELAETGRISLKAFYWRRARRILPPLFLVVLASIPVAWVILLPTELERFSLSLWAALGFFSNGFWYVAQGEYGAQSALLQPFLHTWSLAIEEQFYFVFPMLLAALYRFRVGLALTVLILVSLTLSEVTTLYKPDFSFFSPISRAWELLAGSLLAWATGRHSEVSRALPITRFVPSIAVAFIFFAMCFLPLDAINHPGIVTIPLILATCALILFSAADEPITRLLSTAPFVFFGKLSYSLYLWHFPIFAFGRIYFGDPGWSDMFGLLILTGVFSVLGYYMVEQPFRFWVPARAFFAMISAAICLVCGISLAVHFSDGMPSRFMGPNSLYVEHDFDNERLRDESWSILDGLTADPDLGSEGARLPSRHEREDLWYTDPLKLQLLAVGNSHSKDLFNAFYLNREVMHGIEIARYAMGRELIRDAPGLFSSPNFRQSDIVMIASRYESSVMDELPELIDSIKGKGKKVVLLGSTDEFIPQGSRTIFDWFVQKSSAREQLFEMNRYAISRKSDFSENTDIRLINIANEAGVHFISREGIVCPRETGTCTLISPEGRKTMYDNNHWTIEGARLFGRRMVETGWLARLLELAGTQTLRVTEEN